MTVPTRFSRRQVVTAAACGAGLGVLGMARLSGLAVAEEPVLKGVDEAGEALAPALRLGEPAPTTTLPPEPKGDPEPPPEGMLIFPLDPASDCYVLDNFGDARGCCRLHEGVDIMGSRGQPVYAVVAGVLEKRYTNTGTAGWGWTLYDESTDTVYKYFHLDEDANGFEEGDTVERGDVIGYVGNSGTFGVDNYHLHFEVRPGNSPVDPLPLLVVDREICSVSEPLRA